MELICFLTKELKEVGKAFCELSEEEVDKLMELALTQESISKERFVRLLTNRGDAKRLLSLVDHPEPTIHKACIRGLKDPKVRKALFASINSEETFIPLFNQATDAVKQVLLECLVWNKDRPVGCLADCLIKRETLALSASQKVLLMSACSVEKHTLSHERNERTNKKFFQMSKKQEEAIYVRELYKSFKGDKKDLDKYIKHLKHWWRKFTVDGEEFRLSDLLLDIWLSQYISPLKFVLQNVTSAYTNEFSSGENVIKRGSSSKFRASSVGGFVKELLRVAPFYVMKRVSIPDELPNVERDWKTWYSLMMHARLLGEEKWAAFFMDRLKDPHFHIIASFDSNYTNVLQDMDVLLSKEEMKEVIDGLLGNLQVILDEMDPTDNVQWTSIPSLIYSLLFYVPHDDVRLQKVVERFGIFEPQFKLRSEIGLVRFYGLQQEEIPRDFPYQQVDYSLLSQYATVRKFEKTLFVKGTTFLNKKEAYERQSALSLMNKIVYSSYDVRVVHRFVSLFLQTDLKFRELLSQCNSIATLLCPECLGLLPLSAQCSGTAEEAEKARSGIVTAIEEWVNVRGGNEIVYPILDILSAMFAYASAYPEYEEVYCAMMKPLVCLLSQKKLIWERRGFTSNINGLSVRTKRYTIQKTQEKPHSDLQKEVLRPSLEQEKQLCDGKVLMYPIPVLSNIIALPKVNYASSGMPAFSRTCAVMIISMLEQSAEVDIQHVMDILDIVVSCSLCSNTEETVVSVKEDPIPGNDREVVVTKTYHKTEHADLPLLRELFQDKSFQWEGVLPGLSVLQTLNLMPGVQRMSLLSKGLSKAPQDYVSTSIKKVAVKGKRSAKRSRQEEKKENLFGYLSNNKRAFTAYQLHHGAKMLDAAISRKMMGDLLALPQVATVASVSLDVSGLKWCLKTLDTCFLKSHLAVNGSFDVEQARKLLRVISNENVLSLFELGRVFIHVAIQSAVLAISLNKSETPITEVAVTRKLSVISKVLLDNVLALTLINQEIAYRKLEPEVREITVQSNAPFLTDFLQSVQAGTKQDMKELLKDNSFVMEETAPTPVVLDMSKNEVMCRMIEVIFYNQVIGQYFNTKLPSICSTVNLMPTPVILAICRRLLVVSVYVPYAGNLIMNIVRRTKDAQSLSTIVDTLYDVHHSLSVSLLRLIFRLAALPAMKRFASRLKYLLAKITKHVATNNFQSTAVYLSILNWVWATVLQEDETDMELIRTIMCNFTTLDVTTDAGKSLFRLLFAVTFRTSRMVCDIYLNGDLSEQVSKLMEMYNQSPVERQEVMRALLRDVVTMYNIQDAEEELISYFTMLRKLKLTNLPERLVSQAMEMVEVGWLRCDRSEKMAISALSLLYSVNSEKAMASLRKSMQVAKSLKTIANREMLTDAEMEAMGIPSEYFKRVKRSCSIVDFVKALVSDVCMDSMPIHMRLVILVALGDMPEFKAFSCMAKALLASVTFPDQEMEVEMDEENTQENDCSSQSSRSRSSSYSSSRSYSRSYSRCSSDEGEECTSIDHFCEVDVDKLIAEVQTMEPWMLLTLSMTDRLVLTSVSSDVITRVYNRFCEKKQGMTAGLFCILATRGYWMESSDCTVRDKHPREYVKEWIISNSDYLLYPLANKL